MKYLLVFLFIFSVNAHAVNCDIEYIKYVQIKANGEVVYLTQSGIRRGIGNQKTDEAISIMVQALLLSVEKNLKVQVAYPNGFNCNIESPQAKADWVIIQNVSDR